MHRSMLLRAAKAAVLVSTLVASGLAQEVNPATAQEQRNLENQEKEAEKVPQRLRSWEVPETVVTAREGRVLREEDRIGPYGQPRWTAHRRFPSTRIYVAPPGQFEFEYWTRVRVPREGKTNVQTLYEVEMGLPGRFQFDIYAVTEKTGSEGELDLAEQKFEVRHALADWGEIWGNPTLYLEWVERNAEPDVVEYKLLLGGESAPGWHWGSNLVFEHEVSGALENEYELTLALSHTIKDEVFSLGGEVKAALTDVHEDRGEYEESLEVGPSLQYRPHPGMHIDFAPLVGIGSDSRAMDIFLVIGWEF